MDGPRSPRRWRVPVVLGIVGVLWWLATTGLVSSNDGSHVALGRALLRGQTHIDDEVGLTLWVDRAHREGHDYSDRPPGTAFAALPALALGRAIDPWLLQRSLAARDVVFTPAGSNYMQTHTARVQRLGGGSPPLLALQGTALALSLHTVAMGLAGLLSCAWLLRRRSFGDTEIAIVLAIVGLGTLWGPYSTVSFSHVASGTLLVAMVCAAEAASDGFGARARMWWAVAGLCGAWAVATDYVLIAAVVPLCAVVVPWRRWGWPLLGAMPMALAVALYHRAAFGSPWAVGYDFHTNFSFARQRGTTFDGDLVQGAWTLLGLGEGAGLLSLAPIAWIGIAGLAASHHRRWLLALLPWVVLLCLHHTPSAGATTDHRYLVPAMPLVGVGLAVAWRWAATRRGPAWLRWALLGAGLALALASAALGWLHFFAWRG